MTSRKKQTRAIRFLLLVKFLVASVFSNFWRIHGDLLLLIASTLVHLHFGSWRRSSAFFQAILV